MSYVECFHWVCLAVFNAYFSFFLFFETVFLFLFENFGYCFLGKHVAVQKKVEIRAFCLCFFKCFWEFDFFLEFGCNLNWAFFEFFCKQEARERKIPHFSIRGCFYRILCVFCTCLF